MKLLLWARGQSWYGAWYNALPVAGHPTNSSAAPSATASSAPRPPTTCAKTGTLSDAFRVTALGLRHRTRRAPLRVRLGISNYSGASPRSVVDSMGVLLAGWTKPHDPRRPSRS